MKVDIVTSAFSNGEGREKLRVILLRDWKGISYQVTIMTAALTALLLLLLLPLL